MKFFHVHANARCRKNWIHTLEHEGQTLVTEDVKANAAFHFFDQILGMPSIRSNAINLDILDVCHVNKPKLCERFTEDEIGNIIHALPLDKASGPNGFTARFLQTVWPIIRPDLMPAFQAF
jgi:hypothetical protein